MFMQNCRVTNKEHYGMLWYFLEWSMVNERVKGWTAGRSLPVWKICWVSPPPPGQGSHCGYITARGRSWLGKPTWGNAGKQHSSRSWRTTPHRVLHVPINLNVIIHSQFKCSIYNYCRVTICWKLHTFNNCSLKSRWIVAKYLPSRESGDVSIPKATIHRDWKE